jgi:hypothetical protein
MVAHGRGSFVTMVKWSSHSISSSFLFNVDPGGAFYVMEHVEGG